MTTETTKTKRARKPNSTPTKAQLTAVVAFYAKSIENLLEQENLSGEDYKETLQAIVANVPSLQPVAASEQAVGEETPSEEEAAQ
jgi:hypothetical protein